jgi:gamma-glutamyltranspeptidase/glutathione hydrolase
VLNVLEFGMPIDEAVSAPRLHHQWFPDLVRFEGVKQYPELVQKLKELGHTVSEARQGDAHSIAIDPKSGIRIGCADKRLDGKAVGE